MFRRFLFIILFLFLAGIYGCFGHKVSSVTISNTTDNQPVLTIPQISKIAGVPSDKSQTILKFKNPKKVIYIAVNGNNKKGDGSLTKPFQTLEKAFKLAKANTLIKMQAGTFEVKGMIKVPSRVSLEGMGDKTVIVPAKNYKGVLFEAKDSKNQKGDGYQYFRNFNLDGKNKAKLGIRAWGRENSLFENITFIDFNNAGISVTGFKNEISNCRFINASGREGKNNKNFSGAIIFRSSDGLLIHDNDIEENSGGGIKSVASKIRNTEIYNNTINIKGKTKKSVNKSASIEIWDLQEGNKIYNNDLNAWVSLINQWSEDKEIAEEGNLIFYQNKLHANPGVTDNMSGLEVGFKGGEFYENDFSGFKHRIFWIEGWGGKKKPTKNIKIHHNQFNDCGNAMNLGPNGNGVENITFYDNFITSCNGVGMGMKASKKLVNISVTNNTFVNARKTITLHGKNQQYVNLVINGNQAYNSTLGLDNRVKGLNISSSDAVILKKGLPKNKNTDK